MSPPSPDASGADARRVRLSWPGGARQEAERPEVARPPSQADADDPFTGHDGTTRATPLDVELAGASAVRRALVDAYDRLADRLLHRLRSVGEDMDADLAELRSEMAALRRSVEDLDQRAQLRQVRAAVEELRSDIASLRRSVAERAEESTPTGAIVPVAADGEARDLTAPVLAELAAVRDDLAGEIALLRRRIALRAGAGARDELTDDLVERIAEAVTARLGSDPRRRR